MASPGCSHEPPYSPAPTQPQTRTLANPKQTNVKLHTNPLIAPFLTRACRRGFWPGHRAARRRAQDADVSAVLSRTAEPLIGKLLGGTWDIFGVLGGVVMCGYSASVGCCGGGAAWPGIRFRMTQPVAKPNTQLTGPQIHS